MVTLRHLIMVSLAATLTVFVVPMSAAADEPPEDVAAFFQSEVLEIIRMAGQEESVDVGAGIPDFSAVTRIDRVHEVFVWSDEYIAGDVTESPITSLNEWVAPMSDDRKMAVGTVSAFRAAPGARIELAGYNNDLNLANSLRDLPGDAILISDPPSGSWYALVADQLTPLNSVAELEASGVATVKEFQTILAARYAADIAASDDSGESMGGGAPLTERRIGSASVDRVPIVAGLSLILVGVTLVFAVNRSRKKAQRG